MEQARIKAAELQDLYDRNELEDVKNFIIANEAQMHNIGFPNGADQKFLEYCIDGDFENVNLYISVFGKDICTKSNDGGYQAFVEICKHGDVDMVQEFIDNGVDPNCDQCMGWGDPIKECIERGYIDCATLLLSKNVYVPFYKLTSEQIDLVQSIKEEIELGL